MSPRFSPAGLFRLFPRRQAARGTAPSRQAARQQARQRVRRPSSIEQLEPRQLLAFDYLGITHTAVPTIPTTQAYQYNFEIYNSGPTDQATMYMRHVANTNSLQFDYSTAFNSLADRGANVTFSVPGFGNGTLLPPVVSPNVVQTGPVALAAVNSVNANWNTGTTQLETFHLSKVYVRARPGTVDPTFILHVGDSMPLALTVDFSAAVGGTGTIIIRSNAAETYPAASPANALPPTGAGYDFFASKVYIQAALTPRFAHDYRATDLISIENAITGRLDARVSGGDFVIAAGASVSGDVNVQTGGGIPPSAFGTRDRYGYGGNGGDIIVEGSITNAGTVVLQTFSVDPRTIRTGPSGFIAGASSITLNNAGADGGIINVETRNFSQHNIFAGSSSGPAADIGITVRQTVGNLTINALPASRGRIDLQATAPAANVAINANLDTIGALALTASTLNVTRPLSTQQGDITLTGGSVTLGSNVTAGRDGVGDIRITATNGNVNVTSAAVVQAPGDTITITAPAGSITSNATLVADRLELTAGQDVTARSRVTRVSARAGGAVSLSDDDGLIVDSLETTAAGAVTVSAGGLLDAARVATGGTGDVLLTTTAGGLLARDIRTQEGSLTLRAGNGDIQALGDVFVSGTGRDFVLEATRGNIVMSPSATFTVADQLSFSAPLGRVLTPGSITGVMVTDPGSGYATPPSVTLGSGSGAVVTPTVGSGRVTFVRVLNGGGGYVSAPAVVFDNAGTGGTGAIATAVMAGGSVVGVNVTNGGVNYGSAPRISFVGGGGAGAEAVASINGLTSLVPTNGGSGYQVPPQVVISSGAGATTAAVDVDALGQILAVNVSQGGGSYDAAPTVVITDTSGSGFGATATANLTRGVTAGVVTDGGSGYPATTTATVAGGIGAGATGQVLLGLTNASIATPLSTGANYRIGDLLTVVAGTGARIAVTGVAAGGVSGVSVLGGGRDYSAGDVLYLDDAVLGATGLQATVTAVTTGGVITAVSVTAGGTGYTTAMRFLHAGGSGAILRVTGVSGSPTTTAAGPITAVVVDRPGTGYTTRPSAVAGGSGNGAAITFVDTAYTVVGYRPLTPGQGYTGTPTITVAGTGGSNAAIAPVVGGVLASITVGNQGTAYNPATTRVQLLPVAAGGGASSQAVSVNGAGGITGINVSTPGGGYVAPPRVTIVDLGGTGSGAAAVANLTGNVVTGITITSSGAAYDPATTVVTLEPIGSGATAVANLTGGVVTSISITDNGSGYGLGGAPAPTVTLVPYGSGALATSTLSGGGVGGVTVTAPGTNYAVPPVVTFDTPGAGTKATGVAVVGNVAQLSATRLSWTALEQPLDALLDQFAIAKIVLTGAGDLDVTRASGDLVLEGAETKDGSIRVAAQSLTVTGPVVAGDFNTSRSETVTLRALGGTLAVQAPVTAPLTVTLEAESGAIAGTTAGIVTTKDLVIAAQSGATLRTAVETVRGGVSGDGAPLSITEADNLTVGTGTTSGTTLFANNGPISVTSLDGTLAVNRVDAGTAGIVALSAAVNILAATANPTVAEVVGGSATLTSTSGRIDLDTDVGTIAASAPLATIDLDNVGTGPITVTSATARNTVRIEAASALRVEAANSELNNVSLATTRAGSDLVVGALSAPVGVVTLDSAGDIGQGDLSGAVAATGARVRALAGSVTLATAVGTFGGTAAGDITVTETDGITLGEIAAGVPADFARVRSNTGDVTVTAGGLVSALVVTALQGDVSLTSNGDGIAVGAISVHTTEGVVTLTAALSITDNDDVASDNNDITGFRAVLSSTTGSIGVGGNALDLAVAELSATAAAGTVDVADQGGVDLTGLAATAARLTVAGPVTQTAPITVGTLAVATTTPGGTVSLTAPANNVGTLSGGTNTGTFRFVNAGNLTVGAPGITAGTSAFGDGDIELTSVNGGLTIAADLTAKNDVVILNAVNGTITQQTGTAIDAGLLRWDARSATFNGGIPGTVIGPPPAGTTEIGPTVPGQILVVNGGSYTGNIVIINSGDIRIEGVVTTTGTITVTSQTGGVTFVNGGRLVGTSVALVAATNSQLVVGSGVPVSATTVSNGSLSLSSPGSLRQNGPITATSLSATAGGGSIVLDNQNNSVGGGGFSASAPHAGGNVVFVNAGAFSVAAPGITAGTAAANDGGVFLTAITGNLTVVAGISAIADLVELRAPNGLVTVNAAVNSQNLITIDSQSSVVRDPFRVGNSQSLVDTLAIVNSLPAIPGTTYEIIVTSSMTLTQPLQVSKPVTLRGEVAGIALTGSATAINGVSLSSGASGSRIRDLVFRDFSGTALSLTNATNVAVSDVRVENSGTGIFVQGTSTGSTVQGSRFSRNGTAISLNAAQGVTFGGGPSPNVVSGGSTGVFATGLSLGSSIMGLVFNTSPATVTPFNIGSSRNLTVTGWSFQNVGTSPLEFTIIGTPRDGVEFGTVASGYAIRHNGQIIPITYSGIRASASSPGGGWTAIAARAAGGGYELLWQHAGGSFVQWTLNSQGAQTANNGFLTPEQVAVWLAGGTNENQVFTPIGTANGAVEFGSTAAGYAIRNNGQVVQITYSGIRASASSPGGGWTAIAARAAGSSYELLWQHAGGNFAQWTLNSQGAQTANNGFLTPEQAAGWQTNGGAPGNQVFTPIGTANGAVELGNTAAGYAVRNNGQVVQITFNGSAASASNPGAGWTAIAARAAAGGGYEVLWRHTGGTFAQWTLNSAGARIANAALPGTTMATTWANLGTNAQGQYVVRPSGPEIPVTFNGSPASANNPGAGWTAVAARVAGGGFQVLWRHTGGSFAQWTLDGSGARTGNVGLTSAQVQAGW